MIATDTVAMSLTSFCNPGTLSVVGLLLTSCLTLCAYID